MQRRRFRTAAALGALVLGATLLPAGPAPAGAGPSEDGTVVSGLRNPRGLTFDGTTMYVAESGEGGDGPCIIGPEGPVYYGETGAVFELTTATTISEAVATDVQRVVDGLPSLAAHDNPDTEMVETGTSAGGPADVSVSDGTLVFTIGLGADPAVRDNAPADDCSGGLDGAGMEDSFSSLQRVDLGAETMTATMVANLGTHEADGNPDGDIVDTNPFGVITNADGDHVVADSGANTLLTVTDAGEITTTAVFPPVFMLAPPFLGAPPGTRIPGHAVPTQVAANPDGGYDVGLLTGFPFQPGAASVQNVTDDGTVSATSTVFTNVMDVAWGPDGNLYVLEIAHNGLASETALAAGALFRVDPDTGTRELLRDDLFAPGGIAFGPDDRAYISVCSICPSVGPAGAGGPMTGSVIRFDAVNADALVTVAHDSATTTEDTQVEPQVLDNDSAADPDGVTIGGIVDSGQGSANNAILYQPAAHYVGVDRVIYRACDDNGHCALGALNVTVTATDTDRIAGVNRSQTAAWVSRAGFPGGASAVVIARNDNYPDALAASVLADAVGGPILLTPPGSLDSETAAEVNRLGATTAYIVGGESAVSTDAEQALVDQTSVADTVRISGPNRFATAVEVMDQVAEITGEAADHVYVVEGQDADPSRGWPDAVSVSYLAAAQGRPILLVTTEALPSETADALSGVDATIIGGTAAVSADVEAQVDAAAGTVDRISGSSRYGTSVAVANAAADAGLDSSLLFLASGGNWPDALVAGPTVAATGGVLVLVHPDDLDASADTKAFLESGAPFDDIDLLGGPAAISAAVEQQIAAAVGG